MSKQRKDESPPLTSIVRATVEIEGPFGSSISHGRYHQMPKLTEDESPDAYEQRTYKEKMHYDPATGQLQNPPGMIKKMISESAAYLSIPIPGKSPAKYTKHFLSGILVEGPMLLYTWDPVNGDRERVIRPATRADCRTEVIMSDPRGGRGGSTSRVPRWFLTLDRWRGEFSVLILDGTIDRPVFERVLRAAGLFITMGRFRASKGGHYGRYNLVDINYEDVKV